VAKLVAPTRALTDYEKAFVVEYVKDFDPRKAAIRAGANPEAAARHSKNMLARPAVKVGIDAALEDRKVTSEIEVKRVLEELASIGFSDVADYHRPDGSAIPLDEMPPAARRAIVGVEIKTRGQGRDAVEYTVYKLAPKLDALRDMGKYLGLFKDQLDVNHTLKELPDDQLDRLIDEYAAEAGFSHADLGKETAH